MSSSESNAKDAIEKIEEMNKVEDIFGFVQGDERTTVQEAATARIEKLKQGESGKMTKQDDATIKKGANYIITMRNGKPTRVYFKEGKEVLAEAIQSSQEKKKKK